MPEFFLRISQRKPTNTGQYAQRNKDFSGIPEALPLRTLVEKADFIQTDFIQFS